MVPQTIQYLRLLKAYDINNSGQSWNLPKPACMWAAAGTCFSNSGSAKSKLTPTDLSYVCDTRLIEISAN